MPFERRTHTECLDELMGWIEQGRSFCSLRLTDGELWAMYRYRPPTDRTADGNAISVELGEALNEVLREYCAIMVKDPGAAIQFGTTLFQHPDETTKWLAADVYRMGAESNMRWINGHDMLDGVVDGHTKRLFQALNASQRPCVLMCDPAIGQAASCIADGCGYIAVPKPDSWLHRAAIIKGCRGFAKAGCTFVWCCGMGCKPIAWQLFKDFPQSSHMDCGHIFDATFGIQSREWIRNKEEPWWTPYQNDFAPWVRGFIPEGMR